MRLRVEAVKIWPQILISALRRKAGGAAILVVLAKHMDQAGRGAIPEGALRARCLMLGVHLKSYQRWLGRALDLGFFRPTQRGDLVMLSWGGVAAALRCDRIGPRFAKLKITALFNPGWRADVWAALLATYPPTWTREKLQELTGVPPSTQRAWEKEAGLVVVNKQNPHVAGRAERKPNYAKRDISADQLPGLLEFGLIRKHSFPFKWNNKRVIAHRTADTRSTDGLADRGTRGRSRKMQQHLNSLLLIGAGSEFGFVVRSFHKTLASALRTLKHLAKRDITPRRVTEIYSLLKQGPTAGIYQVHDYAAYLLGA